MSWLPQCCAHFSSGCQDFAPTATRHELFSPWVLKPRAMRASDPVLYPIISFLPRPPLLAPRPPTPPLPCAGPSILDSRSPFSSVSLSFSAFRPRRVPSRRRGGNRGPGGVKPRRQNSTWSSYFLFCQFSFCPRRMERAVQYLRVGPRVARAGTERCRTAALRSFVWAGWGFGRPQAGGVPSSWLSSGMP